MASAKSKKEKKEAEKKAEEIKKEEAKKPEVIKEPALIAFETIREHLNTLDKGETHLLGRVLQVLHKTRKSLDLEVLHRVLLLHSNNARRTFLLFLIPPMPSFDEEMEIDAAESSPTVEKLRNLVVPPRVKTTAPPPEVDLYIHLLVVLYLVDHHTYDKAQSAAESLLKNVDKVDRRSVDGIAAKALFYLALCYERMSKLYSLRSYLNARLRTATLRHQAESEATLIFTLLRMYLLQRQYQTAAKLIDKVSFPRDASNNDVARFVYYRGRIEAMQLNYTAAVGFFQQAMRKAPQESAIGFKQNAQKWIVVIGLLQGEIPERNIFRQPIYRKCLQPYLELTQAVRLGDLVNFNAVLQKYNNEFEKDETVTLIVRLRQNVIKTAVRQITLAYSRIAVKDIGSKLGIASDVETEYMVAKAISDGSIEASLTCGDGPKDSGIRYMQSAETADVYRTSEPQAHFDTRIKYCLELHNQAVKALRFPPKTAVDVESIEQQREREQKELEYAKNIAEEEEDDF